MNITTEYILYSPESLSGIKSVSALYTDDSQCVPLIPGSHGEALRVTWNINTSIAVLFPHIPQQCETRWMASLGEYCIVDGFFFCSSTVDVIQLHR